MKPDFTERMQPRLVGMVILSFFFGSSSLPAHGQSGDTPLNYTLSFPSPETHYVEVDATIPTDGKREIVLFMAVWTPGSYLIREYPRHVENVQAWTPDRKTRLPCRKTKKNRWQVTNPGIDAVRLTYRVYCREMSVRTNWIDREHAILNGAPTFITRIDTLDRSHRVCVVPHSTWNTVVSPLPSLFESEREQPGYTFVAANFDALVDSPLLAGNPAIYEFEVSGKTHLLANQGEGGIWDGLRSAQDTQRIVEELEKFWGTLPYDRYVFFNLINEGGGGLEHRDSTLMMTSRWNSNDKKKYRSWLSLVCHEFFHTWNVKRLRPAELASFDYENEAYTESLWIAEGITSYYTPLCLHRAGLMTRKQLLKKLSQTIERVQTSPGRKVQSLSSSSFDTWIKFYRPDENSKNVSVSYYQKGAVVGFLLDLEIRKLTGDQRSLDDVLRLAYSRFAAKGFTSTEFRETAEEIAGASLKDWFAHAVDSTEELCYDEALSWLGLRFKPIEKDPKDRDKRDTKEAKEEKDEDDEDDDDDDEKEKDDEPGRPWLGLITRSEGDRIFVKEARRETPAYTEGVNVGDEILAIDGYRVLSSQWKGRLRQLESGKSVEILVSRRGQLLSLDVEIGESPGKPWRLEAIPEPTREQKKSLERWLKGRPTK